MSKNGSKWTTLEPKMTQVDTFGTKNDFSRRILNDR